jgi:spore coat protein CotF
MDNTVNLSDCDILNDVLMSEKAMVKNYAVALTEASTDSLYNEFIKIFKDTCDVQRSLFNLMIKKAWYKVEESEEKDIAKKFQEYNNKINEIN